jgi:hypothetical protein
MFPNFQLNPMFPILLMFLMNRFDQKFPKNLLSRKNLKFQMCRTIQLHQKYYRKIDRLHHHKL